MSLIQRLRGNYDSTNSKIIIAYESQNATAKAIVGTVSGTSISFGSETLFSADTIEYNSATYDSTNGKVVIAYKDYGNNEYGTAVVGTVSGTSISFGSAVTFASADTRNISCTYDGSNKVIIAYRDQPNSNYGTVILGTVSGTSISFGTATQFYTNVNYTNSTLINKVIRMNLWNSMTPININLFCKSINVLKSVIEVILCL